MSAYFTIVCDVHEVAGPEIRRGGGGWACLVSTSGSHGSDEAAAEWGSFLSEHDYCTLRLVIEGANPHDERMKRWVYGDDYVRLLASLRAEEATDGSCDD